MAQANFDKPKQFIIKRQPNEDIISTNLKIHNSIKT